MSKKPYIIYRDGELKRIAAIVTAALVLFASFLLVEHTAARLVEQALTDGSRDNDVGHSVAVDSSGNRYITGVFRDRATFGSGAGAVAITTRGQDDVFVAKYDAGGTLVWVRQIGGSTTDQGRGIAVAADGSVYVTGMFSVRAVLVGSPLALNSQGNLDSFIVKYDNNGQALWAIRGGGNQLDNAVGIALDSGGNPVITGVFTGQAQFADIDSPNAATLQSAGSIDIFLVRYDPQGQLLWARQAGGTGNDSGRAVATDSTGDIYLTGAFSAVSAFVSPAQTLQVTSVGADDIFVARYSADGNLRWVQRAGGAQSDRGLAIEVDQQQNSVVTGFFTTNASFGQQTITGDAATIFLTKLNPDGAFLNTKSAGGPGTDEGRGLAIDPQGTIFVTGTYRENAFFGDGNDVRELRQVNRAVVPNSAMFLAAYNPNLVLTFLEGASGQDDLSQSGNDVASDQAGRAHVTGTIHDRATFGIANGRVNPGVEGKNDIFLATYALSTTSQVLYISASSGGTVDGVAFADEDVLAFNPGNNRWSMLIDGSDIGLAGTDIDGFEWRTDGSQLMSFNTPITLPDIPSTVDDSDIVRFIPTQLGANTSGRFELFFDGSDVGLDNENEDIDAIGFTATGRLVISTLGQARVPGATGEGIAENEDLLLFNETQFGEATSGTWELFIDSSLQRLGDDPAEDISALWFQPNGENLVFGTGAPFEMTLVSFGDGADLFNCEVFRPANDRLCIAFPFLDSSSKGFRGEVIDAFSVGDSGVLGDIGDGDDTEAGPPDEDQDDRESAAPSQTIFLPVVIN